MAQLEGAHYWNHNFVGSESKKKNYNGRGLINVRWKDGENILVAYKEVLWFGARVF